jgi:formylglycine-generating enzyme required for sulfatase activity
MPRIIVFIAIPLMLISRYALGAGQIAQVKLLADLQPAALTGVVVTLAFPGYFYVQDSNNVGLRIASAQSVTAGARCNITGTMDTTADEERCVSASSIVVTGSGQPRKVEMTCRNLGGRDYAYNQGEGTGQMGLSDGRGPNNIGAYVRVCGKIVRGGVINDGSADVRLLLPTGAASPAKGSVVSIDGISILWSVGGSPCRALNVADAGSVRTHKAPDSVTPYAGEMIYIPPGYFQMGATIYTYDPTPSEWPQHYVHLDGYWIGKYEVTRGQYRKFIAAGGYNNPAYWSADGWYYRNLYNTNQPAWWDESWLWDKSQFQTDNHPVVGVSWYEAEAYCNWAGLRLPTEAEWEKAAHWNPSRNCATVYPWGDDWDTSKCNWWLDSLYPNNYTAPVGSYPAGASYYGCLDMAGNVWEWVNDWMGPAYYREFPSGGWVNPTGPPSNPMKTKVLKGGSWWQDCPGTYRCGGARSSTRNESFARWNEFPNQWGGRQGFRVAR